MKPDHKIDNARLAEDGFASVKGLLTSSQITELIAHVEARALAEEGRGGVRNLLDDRIFRALADSAAIRSVITPVLGEEAFAVRGILFDKTDSANWKVPWHQDVTIAVEERAEAPGYGPWSIKADVVHVQPPAGVLERMLSVRLHLDDCPMTNGALRVLPGTHRQGKLEQQRIDALVAETAPYTCEAEAGDALLLRPLLLHASSASTTPHHRRVIHFDYANIRLAEGIRWREREARLACAL